MIHFLREGKRVCGAEDGRFSVRLLDCNCVKCLDLIHCEAHGTLTTLKKWIRYEKGPTQ